MSVWKRLWVALVRLGSAGLIIAFIAGIVAAAYFAVAFPDWTGFGPPPLNAQGEELPRAKTLWDWLDLLLVPLVLAVGGYFLTRYENRYSSQLQDRREAEARKLETERAQDAALQAYLDQMTELLLHEKLRTSQPEDEARSVARARTLTVLRVLDGERKATVVQFLYEARLIGGSELEEGYMTGTFDAVVSLAKANLDGASLKGAYLGGANLYRVNLEWANLQETNLEWANLREANLRGADLESANLESASLYKAHLYNAHLYGADLRGANLREADPREADLREADLEYADLRETSLEWAGLQGANLREANLRGADLRGADLREANLRGADLTNCRVTREQLAKARSLEGTKLPFDMILLPTAGGEATTPKDQAGRPHP